MNVIWRAPNVYSSMHMFEILFNRFVYYRMYRRIAQAVRSVATTCNYIEYDGESEMGWQRQLDVENENNKNLKAN